MSTGPSIVIKADDLVYQPEEAIFGHAWNRFIQFAQARGIKVSLGLIGNSLEGESPEYFDAIKALHATGQVEIWNHGYTHILNHDLGESEFLGQDKATQFETLQRTQKLAQEKLGITLRTFGSPFNHKDANTAPALRDLPDLCCWLYGDMEAELAPGQVSLDRCVNMEVPVRKPSFERFQKDFEANPDRPYYVLQSHPGGWEPSHIESFSQIIDFLQARNAEFVLPYKLAERMAN